MTAINKLSGNISTAPGADTQFIYNNLGAYAATPNMTLTTNNINTTNIRPQLNSAYLNEPLQYEQPNSSAPQTPR
jgi:hypothetical protein